MIASPRIFHTPRLRQGLSLLEVVLAMVILAMSIAAIGRLMSIGAEQSLTVLEQSRGQQYAQSLLDSVAVGILPTQSVSWTPIETDPEWEYSLDVQANSFEGLNIVTASVQLAAQAEFGASAQSAGAAAGGVVGTKPSTVSITRWVLDPLLVQDRVLNAVAVDEAVIDEMIAAEAAAAAAAEDAGGGGTGGGGAGGGGAIGGAAGGGAAGGGGGGAIGGGAGGGGGGIGGAAGGGR